MNERLRQTSAIKNAFVCCFRIRNRQISVLFLTVQHFVAKLQWTVFSTTFLKALLIVFRKNPFNGLVYFYQDQEQLLFLFFWCDSIVFHYRLATSSIFADTSVLLVTGYLLSHGCSYTRVCYHCNCTRKEASHSRVSTHCHLKDEVQHWMIVKNCCFWASVSWQISSWSVTPAFNLSFYKSVRKVIILKNTVLCDQWWAGSRPRDLNGATVAVQKNPSK